jgi:hypothetical protein
VHEAKDTTIDFGIIFDIFHAPRGPEMIHRLVEL